MKRSLFLIIPAAFAIITMMSSCGVNRNNPNPVSANLSHATVTTLAGPYFQVTGGPGTPANFTAPSGVAVDAAGNVYVADQGNNLIRKIDPSGIVTTLAGSGKSGSANGISTAASFSVPWGVAADAAGNVYVADEGNNLIRMISPAGVVSTLAGSGKTGSANGTGAAASFDGPSGVAVDAGGNVYVADQGNKSIRKISPDGMVSTLPGSFSRPTGVAVDTSGNVYVVDQANESIVKISGAGVVSTLAGGVKAGSANGTGSAASFTLPYGVAVDAAGNVYVADAGNELIRMITPAGVVSTLAGGGTGFSINGAGTAASFHTPFGVTVDVAGNVYVADFSINMIRKIDSSGVVSTLAGNGNSGSANTTSSGSFNLPSGVAVDVGGNVYVADAGNDLIRKISPSGAVTTLAGSGIAGSLDGTGKAASFFDPTGVAVDAGGNVYVAEFDANLIREISPSGVVTTIAGNGSRGSTNSYDHSSSFDGPFGIAVDTASNTFAYDNIYVSDYNNNLVRQLGSTGVTTWSNGAVILKGPGFNQPAGVAVDAAGIVYVADKGNNVIKKINQIEDATILAGSGSAGSVNDTGAAASFNQPWGVAVDGSGNVYVADAGNNQIRKISAAGAVTTLAGSAAGASGSADGPGYAATFYGPTGVAVDTAGNVYVADTRNNLIRKITQ